jgi:hypothetical protein
MIRAWKNEFDNVFLAILTANSPARAVMMGFEGSPANDMVNTVEL